MGNDPGETEPGARPGFPLEPEPQLGYVIVEVPRDQPEALAELGLTRVRSRMPSGGWAYDAFPTRSVHLIGADRRPNLAVEDLRHFERMGAFSGTARKP